MVNTAIKEVNTTLQHETLSIKNGENTLDSCPAHLDTKLQVDVPNNQEPSKAKKTSASGKGKLPEKNR